MISWYNKNKRPLSFRMTKDPYKIWLSEVMLQQTKVKTALPYYDNWIKKFPTLKSVSLSNLDSLLKLWEGLGYYKRCNNFYKATKLVVSDFNSKIPKEKSLWKGECFVFDNRVSLKHGLNQGTYSICSGCRKPISRTETKSKKYELGVSCPKCHDILTSSQKKRFRMRQSQINLAKNSGKRHIFQKQF